MLKPILSLLIACSMGHVALGQSEEGTTANGLHYQFHRRGEGASLDSGKVALINMRQTLLDGADTLSSKATDSPVPVQIGAADDLVMEGLLMMHEGDSASLRCSVADLFPNNPPPGIPSGATLAYDVGIAMVFDDPSKFEAYMMEKQAEAAKAEEQTIMAYLAEKGLEAKRTASGLYYVVTEPGNGKFPAVGDKISVHYTGTLLDGTKFDSSLDRGQQFEFTVGVGRVIKGWDEGFQLFDEGSKGLLIIPSGLGYGNRDMGVIKPNSVLVFEVEFWGILGQ